MKGFTPPEFAMDKLAQAALDKKIPRRSSRAAYNEKYYQNNKKRMAQLHVELRRRNQKFVRDYKASVCCYFCRESDPVCLDFHHRDPKEKTLDISRFFALIVIENFMPINGS